MTHSEIQEALAFYRDLRGPEREEVDRHIASCAECAARLNAYRVMDRDLSGLRDARPDSRLRQGFSAAIGHDQAVRDAQPARRPRTRFLTASLAAAALLLVVLAGALAFRQGWLPGLVSTVGRPVGPSVPTPRSSLIGSFVWQTDGAYGYRMLRPAGWEVMDYLGVWRAFLLPGSYAADGLGVRVSNLAASGSAVEGDPETQTLLALFQKSPSLEGWTASIEAEITREYGQATTVRTLSDAKLYLWPVDSSPDSRQVRLTGYKVDGGQPLFIDLLTHGAYADLDRLQQEGIVDDMVTMVESARAIPVNPRNVVPPMPQATATQRPAGTPAGTPAATLAPQPAATRSLGALSTASPSTTQEPQAELTRFTAEYPDYALLRANVIARVVDQPAGAATVGTARMLTLDAGSAQGVRTGMPVITGHVVGWVVSVAPDSSIVSPITVADRPLSVKAPRTRSTGTLRGRSGTGLVVTGFAFDAGIKEGDTWLTTGLDGFPPDLLVGQVSAVKPAANGQSGEATLQCLVDFLSMPAALVVTAGPATRYTDPTYGFTFVYPPTWALEDRADQHGIRLHRGDFVLSIGVKGTGEATNITRSGVGAGDLVARGSVTFLGQELSRDVLVYQERDKGVLYNSAGEVATGRLVFTLSLDYGGANPPATVMPYTDLVLPQDIQAEVDGIVESFVIESKPAQAQAQDSGDAPGWTRYTAPYSGLSFAYPPGWQLAIEGDKPDANSGTPRYRLTAPANEFAGGNQVGLLALWHEIGEGQSLAQWVQLYNRLSETKVPNPQAEPGTIVEPDGTAREFLHETSSDTWGVYQRFYLRQGRIVFLLSGYTIEPYSGAMAATLRQILETFRFSTKAASSLNELYETNRQWPVPAERTQQDQPPTPATPRCDVGCQDATASAALALTPMATMTQSPSFRATEEAYNRRMSATETRQAQVTPTATPTPTSTPTPPPSGRLGWVLYHGSSTYREDQYYQISYPQEEWRLSESQLQNAAVPGCILELRPAPYGSVGPAVSDSITLGDRTWQTVLYLGEERLAYSWRPVGPQLEPEAVGFSFRLLLPKGGAKDVVDQCRAASEAVLATFEVVE